jgi:hypothetical protein
VSKEDDPSSPGPGGISDKAWAYHQAKGEYEDLEAHGTPDQQDVAWDILMTRHNEYLGNRQRCEPLPWEICLGCGAPGPEYCQCEDE